VLNNYLKLLLLILVTMSGQEVFSFCYTSILNRYPTVEKEYEASKVVVDGLVLSKKTISIPDDPVGYAATLYKIKLLRIFKGKFNKNIILYSENTSSRFDMDVGQRYIIFAQNSDAGLFVDNCGNSKQIKKSSDVISKIIILSRSDIRRKARNKSGRSM
jgi:hypothetical protein